MNVFKENNAKATIYRAFIEHLPGPRPPSKYCIGTVTYYHLQVYWTTFINIFRHMYVAHGPQTGHAYLALRISYEFSTLVFAFSQEK